MLQYLQVTVETSPNHIFKMLIPNSISKAFTFVLMIICGFTFFSFVDSLFPNSMGEVMYVAKCKSCWADRSCKW
jgi:hypothetical protein